jgi:hypothetical protein
MLPFLHFRPIDASYARFMPNPPAENKVLPDLLWPIDASYCGQPMVQVTNLTNGRSERSERFEGEILWAAPGKQKERVVQGAWLTPEAVPSERERNGHNGECKAELDCLSGDEETNFEWRVLVTVGGPENWKDKIAGGVHETVPVLCMANQLDRATRFGTRW